MSIFDKTVDALNFEDLNALCAEGAVENIRLEFKREIPSRDEILKKVSSFANTYGGFIVIGVGQDKEARASSLPGVPCQKGFSQQVVQWAYDGVYPPIPLVVSPAISDPSNTAANFYVLFVPESHEGPHFINQRKGCYVRTDEYSQRFEAQLATYEEITHLAARRQRSVALREAVIARARSRFEEHVKQNYRARTNVIGDIDLTMWTAIVPTFPPPGGFSQQSINDAVAKVRLAARQVSFPDGLPSTQFEAFYFPNPRIRNFAYLEVDTHGLIFYSEEVGHILPQAKPEGDGALAAFIPAPSDVYVYATWILAWLMFYFRYALEIYRAIPFEGPLLIRVGLDRIRGRKIRIPLNDQGDVFEQATPMLDDSFSIDKSSLTSHLRADLVSTCKELFRAITFSCGWTKAYSAPDAFIEQNVDRALGYLMWNRGELGGT